MNKIYALLLGLAMFLPGAVTAADGEYVPGIEYQVIAPAQPTSVGKGKIEVIEFFWYGCPHCFHFEPHLKKWLKKAPANVVFIRIPAILNPHWELHARAYITAEMMGVAEKTHQAFFDMIHVKKKHIHTRKQVMKFYKSQGVKVAEFEAVFDSFAVEAKLARYKSMNGQYGISGVPTIVINGKYRTSASMTGGTFAGLLKVMSYLVKKESK